jgi:hypothetical protein
MTIKIKEDEWQALPFSELVSVGKCACGQFELFTHPKDAPFTKPNKHCSELCKLVDEVRQSWIHEAIKNLGAGK